VKALENRLAVEEWAGKKAHRAIEIVKTDGEWGISLCVLEDDGCDYDWFHNADIEVAYAEAAEFVRENPDG
jgi:hypothetical protein